MIMFNTIQFLKFLPLSDFLCSSEHLPVKVSINNFIHSVHMSMHMPGC